MKIRSLQQRLVLFLLLPAGILLFATGFLGFLYARDKLLSQWQEAAVLKLERAAHRVDMRLNEPVSFIKLFQKASEGSNPIPVQRWILDRMKKLDGVSAVELEGIDLQSNTGMGRGRGMQGMQMSVMGRMRFQRGVISEVTPPIYDARTGQETVSLISNLVDDEGDQGKLKVIMRFSFLMKDILELGWWQGDRACIVDSSGDLLAQNRPDMKDRKRLGETGDPLEKAVMDAMKKRSSGTVLGPGHPPKEVAGFYKMSRAPWAIVLFAPGDKILRPIIRFRFFSILVGGLCIILFLLLIRMVGGRMVRSIGRISKAAQDVAQGNYGDPLPVTTEDEIGQLTSSFNTMVEGLRERDYISNTFGRYMDEEIARELMRRPEAARLGGEKREVAILMSDLRGFTPLAETLSPDATISILNRYFSRIIETIRKHKGIIVDFFGDALLVFFDPLEGPAGPSVLQAVVCALEMQENMGPFNAASRSDGLPELEMGIGVNMGEVVVGNIGSEARAKYGIVGSEVNLTQRIQARAEGGAVIVSEAVQNCLGDALVIERSFETPLKGVQGTVTLYVVTGIIDQNEMKG